MKKKLWKALVFALVLALLLPTAAAAADFGVVPYANQNIKTANAGCSTLSGGQIRIIFDISSASVQNCLGVKTMILWEKAPGGSWHIRSNFNWENYENLMARNTSSYASNKTVSGTVGWQYYAVVTFWGGSSMTSGESRTFITPTVTAR